MKIENSLQSFIRSGRSDELKANAELLAAAPELLAASKLALQCIERHISATTFAPRELLRSAIAKAEGKL